jgi:hypothetical protein
MIRDQIFAKPAWQPFLHIEGLRDLPLSALLTADQLFEAIRATRTTTPAPSDYAVWAQDADIEANCWLERLSVAAELILPSELENIATARGLIQSAFPAGRPSMAHEGTTASVSWDPCARIPNPRKRQVSVFPWELPEAWQATLRRAAQGLPGAKAGAPASAILERTREKLCQLTWAARDANMSAELSEPVLRTYLEGLETRLRAREQGIRWATFRATVEDLYRFARYTGNTSTNDLAYLRKRLARYELLEKGQDALKFAALLETGNTTLRLLEKADTLLAQAALEKEHVTRHRLRNAAAILGLYSIVPLRNADAKLILGETLTWETGTWVIDTEIRKTRSLSPEHLVVPLEPEFGRYIDTVILGDFDPGHFSALRERACAFKRPLILHADGSSPNPSHIPRVFKEHTGNSFTTTRTMLHTDQAISRGEQGTRDAMVMAHQTSPRTALKYQAKRVRQVAVERVQDASAARRAALMPPDLLTAIGKLKK